MFNEDNYTEGALLEEALEEIERLTDLNKAQEEFINDLMKQLPS